MTNERNAKAIAGTLNVVARTALINAAGRPGARVQLCKGPARRMMEAEGLIGIGHGLTELGFRVRQILVNEMLESAFREG